MIRIPGLTGRDDFPVLTLVTVQHMAGVHVVVPTAKSLPQAFVNVMDKNGSVRTVEVVRVDRYPVFTLADLSGFRVEQGPDDGFDQVELHHRCGWREYIDQADQYLGNVVEKAMRHRDQGCT